MSNATGNRGEVAQTSSTPVNADELRTDQALEVILEALRGLRYGMVSIVVQDGVVIQVDRTEKRRLR